MSLHAHVCGIFYHRTLEITFLMSIPPLSRRRFVMSCLTFFTIRTEERISILVLRIGHSQRPNLSPHANIFIWCPLPPPTQLRHSFLTEPAMPLHRSQAFPKLMEQSYSSQMHFYAHPQEFYPAFHSSHDPLLEMRELQYT